MKQKLLEHYITEAIAKARLRPHRKVSDALADAMPEIVQECRRLALAPETDTPTRRFAISTIESLWRTLVSTAQGAIRTAVKREHVKVRAKRVKVEETKTALKVHQVRAEADKKLAAIGGA